MRCLFCVTADRQVAAVTEGDIRTVTQKKHRHDECYRKCRSEVRV